MRAALPFIVAGLLALTFLTLPSVPGELEMDRALSAVLDNAHQNGLQFGTDLVTTYGPLGFLVFFHVSPHPTLLRLCVDVALCLTVGAGLCGVAWRLGPIWRWLVLACFVWVASNQPVRTDLVINTGLFCWGLLAFVENGRRLALPVSLFTVLAGFAALAKSSFFFLGGASLLLLWLNLLIRKRWRLALGSFGVCLGLMLWEWLITGQELLNFPVFVKNTVTLVEGYNQALGWEMPSTNWIAVVVALLTGIAVLLRALAAVKRGGGGTAAQFPLFAWITLLLFISWKHGVVRESLHIGMFLGFVPVLAFGLELLPAGASGARSLARMTGVISSLLALASLETYLPPFSSSLAQPFRNTAYHIRALLAPRDYLASALGELEPARKAAQMPPLRKTIGASSVDVFGNFQATAIFNELNFRPRPLFQSYTACNSRLMALNERFYLSETAPEYVLFTLTPLDHKFPPLEDSWVLRYLLVNYEPVGSENQFVLLKRRSAEMPKLRLLEEGTITPNQRLELTRYSQDNLWLEIDICPNLAGRLRQFFYRPAPVRIACWAGPEQKLLVRNRAPPSMLAAGFLASPALLSTADVVNLYGTAAAARPAAYSVYLGSGGERWWNPRIGYRLYRIENELGVRAKVTAPPPGPDLVTKPSHPFSVFHSPRWRPNRPPTGGWGEQMTLALFTVLPPASWALLLVFARKMRRRAAAVHWPQLLLGNALVLLFLLSSFLWVGEIYFRFFYDTTDALAFTKVCERWVERHWHLNQAGCRDNVEYSPALTFGKRRVTFVGDSFTAGHGIKNVEDRFVNRLRRAHPEWEVHALANVGLDTGNELTLLKKTLPKGYQLDEVVLVYCLNDISDLQPEEGRQLQQVLECLDASCWLVRDSYFLNFLYNRYTAWRMPKLRGYFSFVRRAYTGSLWEEQKKRLKELRDLVTANGGHLRVVTFPFLNALGRDYEYQFVHDQLNQFWRDLQVPQLDLLPVFRDLPPKQVTVNRYDAHPNEYASKLAAEAIDKFFSSQPFPARE